MKAKLMDGTYYEIGGGLEDDIMINIANTSMNDAEAKEEAFQTERFAYKNTYKQGKIIKSVKLWDPYGDGCYPDWKEYYEPLPKDLKYRYQMLSRLQADCDYFLGNGNGYEGHLWAHTVEDQIKEMRDRWNAFEEDEKPEWLTWEQIDEYERNMLDVREQIKNLPPGTTSFRIVKEEIKA